MKRQEAIASAETHWTTVSAKVQRSSGLAALIGWPLSALFTVSAAIVGNSVASGPWRYGAMGLTALVLSAPMVFLMWHANDQRQMTSRELALDLEHQLKDALHSAEHEAERRLVQVRQQEFETRLANALEMAGDEREVLGAVERALSATLPSAPSELLLADNSHAHLIRMAVASPTGEAPGCPVDSPDQCPAARRAQVQQFADSEALDSCPKLRDRPTGRCSAVCVPVSIMGRTVGVIHATNEPDSVVDDATVADLATLSKLAGARIGLLRVMAETQLQAATDSLTGLLNRRSLENKIRVLRAAGTRIVVAMADLDRFKELNDKYGHETGDRALRLFAQVLRGSLRSDDLVCRYGGEEFALVLPSCGAEQARAALEQVRVALKYAIANASLPPFTASFGLVETSEQYGDLTELLADADAALFDAKHGGRDRIVVHDAEGQRVVARPPRRKRAARSESTNGNGAAPTEVTEVAAR